MLDNLNNQEKHALYLLVADKLSGYVENTKTRAVANILSDPIAATAYNKIYKEICGRDHDNYQTYHLQKCEACRVWLMEEIRRL